MSLVAEQVDGVGERSREERIYGAAIMDMDKI